MSHALLDSTHRLSDADLLQRMSHLAACERGATAQLVAHLAEVEARELHLKAGHGSLFEYCRLALRLSEHEAYNRSAAARAARQFPVILDMLTDGSINLTTVRLLAGHLTAENHRRVLDSARGKRKLQVEEIAAALAPRPDVPTSVRKLPAPAAGRPAPVLSFTTREATAPPGPPATVAPPARPQPVTTAALAPDRYRLQVTIGGRTVEKLRLAADMLGHAVPSGDGAAVIDRALTALLHDLARKKFAATQHPAASTRTADAASRHIPAEVKRTVWIRDLGRCAFVGAGRRCEERRCLEFHHVRPYAASGPATVENIQLRCRRHNQYEARAYFGTIDRDGATVLPVPERAASWGPDLTAASAAPSVPAATGGPCPDA